MTTLNEVLDAVMEIPAEQQEMLIHNLLDRKKADLLNEEESMLWERGSAKELATINELDEIFSHINAAIAAQSNNVYRGITSSKHRWRSGNKGDDIDVPKRYWTCW